MLGGKTDAELSLVEGVLRAAVRQGRDAFSVDPGFFADVIAELRRFRSGECTQVPKTLRHAQAMHLVADAYLKQHGSK